MPEENLKKEILSGTTEILDKQTREIKSLLDEQTVVILNAIDEKIRALDLKFTEKFDKIITVLNKYPEQVSIFRNIIYDDEK